MNNIIPACAKTGKFLTTRYQVNAVETYCVSRQPDGFSMSEKIFTMTGGLELIDSRIFYFYGHYVSICWVDSTKEHKLPDHMSWLEYHNLPDRKLCDLSLVDILRSSDFFDMLCNPIIDTEYHDM